MFSSYVNNNNYYLLFIILLISYNSITKLEVKPQLLQIKTKTNRTEILK